MSPAMDLNDPALQSALASLEQPIVVVGGAGMLARAFREIMQGRVEHAIPPEDRLDITDATSLRRAAMGPWRTFINCAAFTDVDGAETNEQAATAVNATGVALLAQTCREAQATLVHFSTDYVFDGQAASPYAIDHPRAPIGAYGRSKALGEEAIEREVSRGLQALCVRTSWLYAPWGKNFVRTIAKLAAQKPSLRVVNDQRGRPTSAEHLALATLLLLARKARGLYHVTDGGECTWFDMATQVAAYVNPACRVTPCTTAEFPRPAKRPPYSVLDLSKTEALIGPMPDWKANLAAVLGRLEP
jgi:dTDP-4-dehydrorhamnose reductase